MHALESVPQPLEESYRIPLSQGQFAVVDADDFERINRWKWSAWLHKKSGRFYAIRGEYRDGKHYTVYMAREVLNAPKGLHVDHREADNTLDNRRANLRLATPAQNNWNHGRTNKNWSGYKGVTRRRGEKNWIAQIRANGVVHHLGRFSTAELAAIAYREAAIRLHGEFARF